MERSTREDEQDMQPTRFATVAAAAAIMGSQPPPYSMRLAGVNSHACQLDRQYIEAEAGKQAGKQATEKHLRIPQV